MLGADADALDELAIELRTAAERLDGTRARLSAPIHQSPWSGTGADRFRADWNSRFVSYLVDAATALRGQSEELISNASAQRDASSGATGAMQGPRARVDLDDPREHLSNDAGWWQFWDDDRHHDFDKKNFADGPLYPDGQPSLDDVVQGALGNCWLMAALSSMAATPEGRRRLMSMIRDNGDGTYTVTFADGKEVRVDADLYVRDGSPVYASGDGNWVQIIEKAYAARQMDEGFESIVGGHADDALEVLGGYDTEVMELNPSFARDPSDDHIARTIRSALDDGRPVTASGASHAWTITDMENGYVTVRNPWGPADEANVERLLKDLGLSGRYHELHQGDGYFRIPIDDFSAGFDSLRYAS